MIDSLSQYVGQHSWQIFMIGLVVFLVLVFISKIDRGITALIRWNRDKSHRDAKRVYTSKEKKLASELCMHQCEGIGLFIRCPRRGSNLQGDHWFPHARGGATTIRNLVMLCPKCNRKKTDKIPSRFQTFALRMRRKSGIGYKKEIPTKVGQWLPYSYRADNSDAKLMFF